MGQILQPGFIYWDGFKYILTSGTSAPISINGTGLWHESSSVLDPNAYIGTAGQFVLTNSSANDTAWVTLSGDISASLSTPGQLTVTGIRGVSLPTPTGTNTFLNWSGTSLSWSAASGSGGFTAGSDLTGTSTNQTVIRINGANVPISGGLTTGNALQVNGSSSLVYAPINLGGGSNYVNGILPVSNIPNLFGDVTGVLNSNTVIKLQNNPVSSAVPASGNVLTWNGSAWAPAASSIPNLLGDVIGTITSNTVIALQGHAVSAAAPTANNQLLSWNGSVWIPSPASPTPTNGNVLTWNSTSNAWVAAAAGGGSGPSVNGYGFAHITANNFDGTASHGSQGQIPISTLVSGNQDAIWSNFSGDISNSNVTAGLIKVTGIQNNPVSATAATAGQFLIENSSATGSAWRTISGDISASVSTTGLLTVTGLQNNPVSAAAPASGNVLVWNGSAWAPAASSVPSLSGDVTGAITSNTVIKLQGHAVSATAPTANNQLLSWNGSVWIPSPAAPTPSVNDVLTWNGSAWVAAASGGSGLSVSGSGFIHVTSNIIDGVASHGTIGQLPISSGADSVWSNFSGDTSNSNVTPGLIKVTGIQNNPVSATAATAGQFLIENASANGSAWRSISGDVSASVSTTGLLTVTGIRGINVPSPTGSNNFLNWNGSVFQWLTTAGGITALTSTFSQANPSTGDVVATGPGSVVGNVVGIQGIALDTIIGTAPVNGNVIQYNSGTGKYTIGAVNLSGGSSSITGVLPLVNGGTGAANGSATQFNVLTAASNGSPATWGTVNLASGNAIGSSILPTGNGGTGASLSVGSNNQVLTSNGGSTIWAVPTIGIQSGGSPVAGSPATTINFGTGLVASSVSGGVTTITASGGSGWLLGGNSSPSPATMGSTTATAVTFIYNNTSLMTLASTTTVDINVPFLFFTGGSGGFVGTSTNTELDIGSNNTTVIRVGTSQTVGIGNPAVSFTELTVQAQAGSNNAINALSTGSGTAIIANAASGSGIGLSASSTTSAIVASSSGANITTDITSNGSGPGLRSRALGGGAAVVADSTSGGGPGITATCAANTCISGTSTTGVGISAINNTTGNPSLFGTNNGGGEAVRGTMSGGAGFPCATFINSSGTTGTSVVKTIIGINNDAFVSKMVDCWDQNGAREIGYLGRNGSIFTAQSVSDRRLKENIIDSQVGIETLNKIKVREFNMKDDPSKTKIQGFIAQELYKVYSRPVGKGGQNYKENPWTIGESALAPLLVKSIQDLSKENKAQKKIIAKLEKRLQKLEGKK